MIPAVYRWVSLCPPFCPDRLSWWSKASILKDSTWVFKLVWKNPIQSDNTARWRWSGNSVLTPMWRWCADRSPLMIYPLSRTDIRSARWVLCDHGAYQFLICLDIFIFLLPFIYLRCYGNMETWWFWWLGILVYYVWWRTFWKHLLLLAVSDKAIFFLPETDASSFTDMNHHHSAIV